MIRWSRARTSRSAALKLSVPNVSKLPKLTTAFAGQATFVVGLQERRLLSMRKRM